MLKLVEFITEVLGWLMIAASPSILGVGGGFIIYLIMPSGFGFAIGILLAALGLFIGIKWATKVWKKTGTMNYLSRRYASPELDKKDDKESNS